MTAAQLFAKAKADKPEILESIAKGDFEPLMSWLIMNVHSKGCSLSTKDLITSATGEPLNAKYFKSHLQNRYLNWTESILIKISALLKQTPSSPVTNPH